MRRLISAGGSPQIFVPLTIDPARENRGNHVVRVVGRLRPGVSLDRARDEMRRIAAAMEQEFPATNKDWGVRLETLYDSMLDERVRPSLLVLLAAVGMVLLIACANVANVLLARGISRQRELALRTALGAGRSRLVRQLVTESVCLAVVSGACGLLLAVFAVQTLRVMLPPTLPRIDEIRVDATVLGSACSCRSRAASSWGWCRPCARRASLWCLHSRSRARGSPVHRGRSCDTPSSSRRWPSRRCCSWVRRCCCRVSSGCSTSAPGSTQKA